MISIFLFAVHLQMFAQSQEEKIKEYELQRQAADRQRLSAQLDSAILLSAAGNHVEADERFRLLLKSLKSVPSDLVYHFGENSFHLGNFKQSIDWLNKYIQLKGTSGQYSEQAVTWLKKAENELMKEKKIQSEKAAQVLLSRDYDIDCGPTGKVTCPVCKGSTVIIKKGYMDDSYKTCPYCNKRGYLECSDYNLLMKGQLEPQTTNH